MENFKELLQKNSFENSYEKRMERYKIEVLEKIFKDIKEDCLTESRYGGTYLKYDLTESLFRMYGFDKYESKLEDYFDLGLFYEDYITKTKSKQIVLIDTDKIINYLKENLAKIGLNDVKFEEFPKKESGFGRVLSIRITIEW